MLRIRIPLKRPETANTSALEAQAEASQAGAPTDKGTEEGAASPKTSAAAPAPAVESSRVEEVGEIEELKDQVLVAKTASGGLGAHVVHQYAMRMVRGAVLKFLMARYAEQVAEGESVEGYGKSAEAKEHAVEALVIEKLGLPSFDVELN